MPRNFLNTAKLDSEPMLGEVVTSPQLRLAVREMEAPRPFGGRKPHPMWLPDFARVEPSLDTDRWLTRGARGLSWNRGGKSPRTAH